MEALTVILMALTCLSFMLKLTWHRPLSVIAVSAFTATAVGLSWPLAIEQSMTQIEGWLADSGLMLDISVILSAEVVIQMAFCMTAAHVMYSGKLDRKTIAAYRMLRFFPGLLLYPVLFALLTFTVFALPGVSFPLVGWGLAAGVLVLIPAGTLLAGYLFPDKEMRLELLFLCNCLTAVLGIIATVNGRTSAESVSSADTAALAGTAAIAVAASAAGFILYRIRMHRKATHADKATETLRNAD